MPSTKGYRTLQEAIEEAESGTKLLPWTFKNANADLFAPICSKLANENRERAGKTLPPPIKWTDSSGASREFEGIFNSYLLNTFPISSGTKSLSFKKLKNKGGQEPTMPGNMLSFRHSKYYSIPASCCVLPPFKDFSSFFLEGGMYDSKDNSVTPYPIYDLTDRMPNTFNITDVYSYHRFNPLSKIKKLTFRKEGNFITTVVPEEGGVLSVLVNEGYLPSLYYHSSSAYWTNNGLEASLSKFRWLFYLYFIPKKGQSTSISLKYGSSRTYKVPLGYSSLPEGSKTASSSICPVKDSKSIFAIPPAMTNREHYLNTRCSFSTSYQADTILIYSATVTDPDKNGGSPLNVSVRQSNTNISTQVVGPGVVNNASDTATNSHCFLLFPSVGKESRELLLMANIDWGYFFSGITTSSSPLILFSSQVCLGGPGEDVYGKEESQVGEVIK